VKKWAAGAAIVAATIYLLLSGNQVAALRSHLMLSIALIAVIVDRPAITMHTIAVSAVAILLMDPSNALEPSFLMSYLAVIALVASYDLWRLHQARRPPPKKEDGIVLHGIGAALRHVEGLAFSSLIAGLATAPVIAGIFYRGAPYSILANMIVLPVTGILIMPAAVFAALLMPFGLDALPLWAMGQGIDFMVAVGRWVSSFPGGAGFIGLPHPLMMPLGVLAVLWLSLWRSRVRFLGLVPALAATILLLAGPRPDVFVGRHGSPVAVRDVDGRLHVLAGPQDRFDTAIWLAADADPRPPDPRALGRGWSCDTLGCAYRLPGLAPGTDEDLVVAVVRDARAFEEDCRRATLVISALEAPPGCAERTTVVDRVALAHGGATMLSFTGDIRPGAVSTTHWTTGTTEDLARAPQPPSHRGTTPIDPTQEIVVAVPEASSNRATMGATPAIAPTESRDTVTDADSAHAEDEPGEPTSPRQALTITTSLPRGTRPWTPRDVLTERREAAARERAATGVGPAETSAGSTRLVLPDDGSPQ
jgi:competence protein ComEC